MHPFESPFRVPFEGDFDLSTCSTRPPADAKDGEHQERKLAKEVRRIAKLQDRLYAEDHQGLLLVFQAMDAAGKDSTIRECFTGVNPAGFQVHSFKAPSSRELDQDFLWRTAQRVPQRGRIGIFNRSHYEECLVVRVHPEYLEGQRLVRPRRDGDDEGELLLEELWPQRFASIREHERHLFRNGTTVVKFFLHVSQEEQARRFLRRLKRPDKHWKFSAGDLKERRHWEEYMAAYQDVLRETSRSYAPWYVIPADEKPYMRRQVARIVRKTLQAMDPQYPAPDPAEEANYGTYRELLERESQ